MTVFQPTPFTTPITNPALGGYGAPVPYISPASYNFAPTAIDTSTLVAPGSTLDETQALYDTIRRASGYADRFLFGADPSGQGASLCATQSTETAYCNPLQGEYRPVCSYKPVIEIVGMAAGSAMSALTNISQNVASNIWIEGKVLHVPGCGFPSAATPQPFLSNGTYGPLYFVWSYINGYPHSSLAATVAAGDSTLTLKATGPDSTLLGIIPGLTQMTIEDGSNTETFLVAAVDGTMITTAAPLTYGHRVPQAPDFLPVTSLPADVGQAIIFLTTSLIKTRGDNSLVLAEIAEPRQTTAAGQPTWMSDVATAKELLQPYQSVTKIKR